jgi:hypothetical protein
VGAEGGERRRQLWLTGQQERGGEKARWRDRLTGGVRLSARAGARKLGRLGLDWLFLFPGNFYLLFYLFSLGFSIQIQIKFQIQTKSNKCNKSKNI